MRFTTFDGKSVALLDFAPDWVQPFQCDKVSDRAVSLKSDQPVKDYNASKTTARIAQKAGVSRHKV